MVERQKPGSGRTSHRRGTKIWRQKPGDRRLEREREQTLCQEKAERHEGTRRTKEVELIKTVNGELRLGREVNASCLRDCEVVCIEGGSRWVTCDSCRERGLAPRLYQDEIWL